MQKTLSVSLLLAGALLHQGLAGNPPHQESLTLRVLPEREAIHRSGSREVIVQVDLEGKRVTTARKTPMNLAIVLDRSGSMAGAKLEKARQAAALAVEQLADEDRVALVTYHSTAEVLIPMQRVGGTENRRGMKAKIHAIEPAGGTALYAGVKLGSEQLGRELAKEHVNRVILLSDGLANVGPQSPSDLAKLGKDLRDVGMSVSTVGLGDDYNEDLMTALAESSSANYYYVKDAEKLPGIFAEELGAVRSVLARGVTIKIEVPEGVRLREIIGQPEIQCRDRVAEIKLPEYFSADRRQFLARCVIDDPKTEQVQVAKVNLAYNDTEQNRDVHTTLDTSVKIVEDVKVAEQSIKPDVASNFAAVQNRLDKEAAVALADQGKAKEAAQLLRSRVSLNSNAPAEQQMKDVIQENQKLEQTIRELETSGQLGKASRKQVQYENWQGKYQKQAPVSR